MCSPSLEKHLEPSYHQAVLHVLELSLQACGACLLLASCKSCINTYQNKEFSQSLKVSTCCYFMSNAVTVFGATIHRSSFQRVLPPHKRTRNKLPFGSFQELLTLWGGDDWLREGFTLCAWENSVRAPLHVWNKLLIGWGNDSGHLPSTKIPYNNPSPLPGLLWSAAECWRTMMVICLGAPLWLWWGKGQTDVT